MTVSLTKSYAPGTVVRVVRGPKDEVGILGYVRRTKPTNGDEVLVGVISQPNPVPDYRTYDGVSLSYTWDALAPEAQ